MSSAAALLLLPCTGCTITVHRVVCLYLLFSAVREMFTGKIAILDAGAQYGKVSVQHDISRSRLALSTRPAILTIACSLIVSLHCTTLFR